MGTFPRVEQFDLRVDLVPAFSGTSTLMVTMTAPVFTPSTVI